MNKNFLVALLAIIVIGAGAYFVMNRTSANNPETMMQDSQNQQMDTNEDKTMQQENSTEENEDMSSSGKVVVKEFTVVAKPFTFTPGTITVKKGDTVTIILDNQEGTHNLMLDEFNVKTKTVNAGETDTVQFVADKAGTFEYYCGIGNHRAMGMVGKLIVE